MKEVNEKLLRRIRKMLAMAEGKEGNEVEAATAANMVAKLMAKHNLSMSDVTLEELKSDVIQEVVNDWKWTAGRAPQWVMTLAVTIGRTYESHCLWFGAADQDHWVKKQQMSIAFVGQPVDVNVCIEMFKYLYTNIIRLSEGYYITEDVHSMTNSRIVMNSYREGCMDRICNKLRDIIRSREESQSTGKELVVRKDTAIAEYLGFKPTYSNSNRQHTTQQKAYSTGFVEGGAIGLNQQVTKQ